MIVKITFQLLLFLIFNSLFANSFASKSMNSIHKLIYFDAKGAAELIRILLKIGEVEFEDYRFPIKIKEGVLSIIMIIVITIIITRLIIINIIIFRRWF